MLVIRKELKVAVGIGAAVLGVAALYGGMSLLSGSGHTSDENKSAENAAGVDTIQIDNGNRPILEQAVAGLPPKDDAPIAPANNNATPVDPFAESARTDGSSNVDKWTIALNTGRVSTESRGVNSAKVAARDSGPIFTSNPVVPANTAQTTITTPGGTGTTTSSITTGTYVIQNGDTFSRIAQKVYGNRNLYHYIEQANPDLNPSRLKIGTQIKVPEIGNIKTERGSLEPITETVGTIDASKQYRVQPGDTLNKIAIKLYGRGVLWQSIYDANKQKIGPDAGKLRIGTVLDLPEAPKL